MALTKLGNTAFGTSSVLGPAIKDGAVDYDKLSANTAHTDRNNVYTTAQSGSVYDLGVRWGTAGNTVTIALNTSNYYTLVANSNLTIANPTSISVGQAGSLFVNANGVYTTSWGSYWRFAGATVPTMSTVAGKVDRVDYVVQTSNTIHAVATIDLLGTS
jgi:hypothetical protein